jgi:UDP-glucose 4-epimerase
MPAISGGRFVVIGGASLAGSHIGERLLAGGAREVVLADNLSLGSTDNIDALLSDSRCAFVRSDALRLNEMVDTIGSADGVFAVAGFLGKPITANPWTGLDVNIRGLQNILEASRFCGVRKVVFSSSVGVYGALGDEPNTDDSPLRWQSMPPGIILYCASKVIGEGLGRLYHQRYGLGFLALRYTAMYGERQHRRAADATRIVEAWERIRAGLPPRIGGDGTQVQDYIYAGDVARANLMAMESDVSGEGMNIASGVDTPLTRMVELVTQACRSDLQPEYFDDPMKLNIPLVTRQRYSRERARTMLGWEPEVSIEEGIRRLVAWLDADAAKPGV